MSLQDDEVQKVAARVLDVLDSMTSGLGQFGLALRDAMVSGERGDALAMRESFLLFAETFRVAADRLAVEAEALRKFL